MNIIKKSLVYFLICLVSLCGGLVLGWRYHELTYGKLVCPPDLSVSLAECEKLAADMYNTERDMRWRLTDCHERMTDLAVLCGMMSPQE